MYKKLLAWLVILVISVSAVGCGNSADKSVSAEFDGYGFNRQGAAPMETESAEVEKDTSAKTDEELQLTFSENVSANKSLVNVSSISQKIIFTGKVNLETLDFEKTKNDLCQYITSIGGFTQNSSVNGSRIGHAGMKKAEFVFRIPKDKYSQSLLDLKQFGTVVLEESNGEDVTEKYFDTEARLKTLKIQQERLQALLNKATKMEDILKIEGELQQILYEIEGYTGTLRKWDSLVQYATLSVNIDEVEKIKPIEPKKEAGFADKIADGFMDSLKNVGEFLQNFIIFVAAALPVIIPLGLVCFLLYKIFRKRVPSLKDKLIVEEKPKSNGFKNDVNNNVKNNVNNNDENSNKV